MIALKEGLLNKKNINDIRYIMVPFDRNYKSLKTGQIAKGNFTEYDNFAEYDKYMLFLDDHFVKKNMDLMGKWFDEVLDSFEFETYYKEYGDSTGLFLIFNEDINEPNKFGYMTSKSSRLNHWDPLEISNHVILNEMDILKYRDPEKAFEYMLNIIKKKLQ